MGSTCNIEGIPNITLETKTWSRDSYGLFDYESDYGTKHKFMVKSSCKLTRNGGTVELKELKEDPDRTLGSIKKELANIALYNQIKGLLKLIYKTSYLCIKIGTNYLFNIFMDQISLSPVFYILFLVLELYKSHYWIYNSACEEEKESHEPLFLSLRNYVDNNKMQGARLVEGDIIKLGKCKFEIQEIVDHIDHNDINLELMDKDPVIRHSKSLYNADQESNVSESKDIDSQELEQKREEKKEIEDNHCRICLGEENTLENPLFQSPCKCSGSIRSIHVNCLKQWLDSKVNRKKTAVADTYTWKHFECDICKTSYPDVIMGPGNVPISIFTVTKPSNNYMMLHSLVSPNSRANNMIQIIHLNKKKVIRIGRGQQNDLRINDISVSRDHAEMRIKRGKVYLVDRKAKYGTLLMLKRPVFLNPANLHMFQAGRTLLSFSHMKSNCICLESKASQIPDYTPTIEELSLASNGDKKMQSASEEAHAVIPQQI